MYGWEHIKSDASWVQTGWLCNSAAKFPRVARLSKWKATEMFDSLKEFVFYSIDKETQQSVVNPFLQLTVLSKMKLNTNSSHRLELNLDLSFESATT